METHIHQWTTERRLGSRSLEQWGFSRARSGWGAGPPRKTQGDWGSVLGPAPGPPAVSQGAGQEGQGRLPAGTWGHACLEKGL